MDSMAKTTGMISIPLLLLPLAFLVVLAAAAGSTTATLEAVMKTVPRSANKCNVAACNKSSEALRNSIYIVLLTECLVSA